MPATTFAAVLATQLRTDAARPLVTFYDDATGERIELSVTTYANWVAKTAALLQDELDLERGQLALVDLPTHWLGAVWLGAAWSLGLRVTADPSVLDDAGGPAVVACGPDRLAEYADAAATVQVVAMSLRPMAGRFTEALPTGVVDYAAVVLGQPDAFTAYDPPAPDDEAWVGSQRLSQSELVGLAESSTLLEPAGRLLTDVNPCSDAGLTTLLAPLVAGGGTVWVRHPEEAGWERRRASERATATLRAQPGA
ncbi:MAG TPA: TIGR03089 family protein [Nocardioides sp.]|uniref:TIGR03089 family protein n=1 Tax=Nocardioides sp. TaxID=35761 RepID=UPI002D805890|nr:TIGR03089 family protein [Nocardioides sp.]HET6654277.1 TIGR03089 family protein [Nocardioides sp.]